MSSNTNPKTADNAGHWIQRVYLAAAELMLRLQSRWSSWMSRGFNSLQARTRKIVTILFFTTATLWFCRYFLYSHSPVSSALAPVNKPTTPGSTMPSDSLLLLEYIYKSTKKSEQ